MLFESVDPSVHPIQRGRLDTLLQLEPRLRKVFLTNVHLLGLAKMVTTGEHTTAPEKTPFFLVRSGVFGAIRSAGHTFGITLNGL